MNKATITSILVMIVIMLAFLTAYKLDSYPVGDNCCRNIKSNTSKECIKCNSYNLVEKIIYVWKFS